MARLTSPTEAQGVEAPALVFPSRGLLGIYRLKFAQPDIAKPHWVSVVLELDRPFFSMGRVLGSGLVAGGA